MKKYIVKERITTEKIDIWEFKANNMEELKRLLKDPYYQKGIKLDTINGDGSSEIIEIQEK